VAEPENTDLRIEVVCAAAADRDGIDSFHIASRGRVSNALTGHGLDAKHEFRGRFHVPIFSIDTIVEKWRRPGFIKIDVESAELRVLQGAQQTLMRDKPIVFTEVSAARDQVRGLLEQCGHRIFRPTVSGELIPIENCDLSR
jgi:FkbM family methyltransferase